MHHKTTAINCYLKCMLNILIQSLVFGESYAPLHVVYQSNEALECQTPASHVDVVYLKHNFRDDFYLRITVVYDALVHLSQY